MASGTRAGVSNALRACIAMLTIATMFAIAPPDAVASDTSPPTGLAVQSTSHTPDTWSSLTQVQVNLTQAQDPESGVAGYSWVWNTNAEFTNVDTTVEGDGSTTVISSPVTPASSGLYLHVVAVNGDGVASNIVHLGPFMIDGDAPDTPTGVADGSVPPDIDDLGSSTTASLHHNASSDLYEGTAMSGLDHYLVCLTTFNTGTDCTTTAARTWASGMLETTHTLTGLSLTDGVRYYACVMAVDAVGNMSAASCSDGAVVDSITTPPTACIGNPQSRGAASRITLQWAPASDTTGMTGYEIRYRRSTTATWNTVSVAMVQEHIIQNLAAGFTYLWEISSREASGLISTSCTGTTVIPEFETITGSPGGEVLVGFVGRDKMFGGAGNDFIYGNEGSDQLYGGDGNDLLQGADGDDLLDGGAGDDQLNGLNGADVITGRSGNDRLNGGSGTDRFSGGDGNDYINSRDGRRGEVVRCGRGIDRVVRDRGDSVSTDCERVTT